MADAIMRPEAAPERHASQMNDEQTEARRKTAAARAAHQRYAAERAVDDPIKLGRATRIVRAALERGRLSPADITPDAAAS